MMSSREIHYRARNWTYFPGRNKFYCDGRFITAPDNNVLALTCILITSTSLLFFIFDTPLLAKEVSQFIPIIGALLYIFTMINLLRTGLSDPGIIPRATREEAAETEKQIEIPNATNNNATYRPPPRTKEIIVRGFPMKLKYCSTCKIFRPPRASHCSICDNCVDRFDHHCPWVGNCIGRRNYRFFYFFIISLTLLAVYIFTCALAHILILNRTSKTFYDAMNKTPTSVFVGILSLLSTWGILALAGYHTYLIKSNQTTNEDIKGSFVKNSNDEKVTNPFSRGNACLNWLYVICGPLPPSLIDARGFSDSYRLERSATERLSIATIGSKTDLTLVTMSPEIGTKPPIAAIKATFDLELDLDMDLDLDPVVLIGNEPVVPPSCATENASTLNHVILSENTMIDSELDLDYLPEVPNNEHVPASVVS